MLDLLSEAQDAEHTGCTRYLCEKALKDDPDDGLKLIRYASALTAFSQYEKAKEVLERAELVVPARVRHLVFSHRGHCLRRMGQLVEAEAQYMLAHDLNPDDAGYLIFASAVAFQRGDIAQAKSYACDALDCSKGLIDEALFTRRISLGRTAM